MEATNALISRILSRWDAAGVQSLPAGVTYIFNVVTGKCKLDLPLRKPYIYLHILLQAIGEMLRSDMVT